MKILLTFAMLAGVQANDEAIRLKAAEKKAMESCLAVESDVTVCDCGISLIKQRMATDDLLLVLELIGPLGDQDQAASLEVLQKHGLDLNNQDDQARLMEIFSNIEDLDAICKPSLPKPQKN